MYSFDSERKILFAHKLPYDHTFQEYRVNEHYYAMKQYLYTKPENGDFTTVCLANDMRLIGELFSKTYYASADVLVPGPPLRWNVKRIMEHDTNGSLKGEPTITVFGSFTIDGITTKDFPMFRLPVVTEDGTIFSNGVEYAISCTSEPSKYITFNGKDKISMMSQAKKIEVIISVNSLRTCMSFGDRTKMSIHDIIFMLARDLNVLNNNTNILPKGYQFLNNIYNREVIDPIELIRQIRLPSNIEFLSKIEDNGRVESIKEYGINAQKVSEVNDYSSVYYGQFGMITGHVKSIDPNLLMDLREQINNLVSIDRGVGEIISRDVIKDGVIVARRGQEVTKSLITRFNELAINCYYVVKYPKVTKQSVLADDIVVQEIPAGIFVPRVVRDVLNITDIDENNVTICSIFSINDDAIVLPEGMTVNYNVLRFIYSIELSPNEFIVTRCDGFTRIDPISDKNVDGINKLKRARVDNTTIRLKRNSKLSGRAPGNAYYITIEEEILGNQHFMRGGKWVFENPIGEVGAPSPYLTIYDALALLSISGRLIDQKYLNRVSDRDLGVRKKMCLIDDLLHKAIRRKSDYFANHMFSEFKNWQKYGDDPMVNGNAVALENVMKRLYYSIMDELKGDDMRVLSQVDKTNPIAYLSFTNRINTIVSSTHAVPDEMRLISMGYYGRICPYETPASAKLGLSNTLAHRAWYKNNEIITEYYRVIHSGDDSIVDFSEKIPMTIMQEEKYRIADLISLNCNEHGIAQETGLVLARVPQQDSLEKVTVQNIPIGMVDYVNCYPDQTLSITATLIPYFGSNNAVRDSFELPMSRQARSLVHREIPTVLTLGNLIVPDKNRRYQIRAEDNGVIESINPTKSYFNGMAIHEYQILVRYDSLKPFQYHPNEEVYECKGDEHTRLYTFRLVEYSHQTVVIRHIEVQQGQRVNKGDIIVSSNFTKDGILSMTINSLVAIFPAKYNYEDGVFMSESCAKRTASYGHTEDVWKAPADARPKEVNCMNYHFSNSSKLFKWNNDKIMQTPYATSGSIRGYIINHYRVYDKRDRRQNLKSTRVKTWKVETIAINQSVDGDKFANRHGNKGVATKVRKDIIMPYLSNGQVLDIVYNPLGIGSRMNVGQIKELHIGLACHVLGIHECIQQFNELDWEDDLLILEYAWECANLGVQAANSNPKFHVYPEEMRDFVASRENLISVWAGVFDKDGCAEIFDPLTGKKLNGRVPIGIQSTYKLVQEVMDKENERGGVLSGAKYQEKSDRPTKGAKEHGGQTYGYMELTGLLAHGAVECVDEIMNQRGDNPYRRAIMIADSLGVEDVLCYDEMVKMEKFDQRRSVEDFISRMKALGIALYENGVLMNSREETKGKYYYKNALLRGELNREKLLRSNEVDEYSQVLTETADTYDFDE